MNQRHNKSFKRLVDPGVMPRWFHMELLELKAFGRVLRGGFRVCIFYFCYSVRSVQNVLVVRCYVYRLTEANMLGIGLLRKVSMNPVWISRQRAGGDLECRSSPVSISGHRVEAGCWNNGSQCRKVAGKPMERLLGPVSPAVTGVCEVNLRPPACATGMNFESGMTMAARVIQAVKSQGGK